MNETLQIIAKRYSCRGFDPRPVEKEKLEAIALAGVQAPSAMGREPWQIYVITDTQFIAEMDAAGMAMLAADEDQSAYNRFMDRGGKLFYGAPVMFVILRPADKQLDCGIVTQNITLAAESLGLGTVICGMAAMPFNGPRGAEFMAKLNPPADMEFGMSVLVGYPKAQGAPHNPDLSKIHYIP